MVSWPKIQEKLGKPVDIASIVFLRWIFGLIILWEVIRYFDHGWIHDYWIEPAFHFGYYGFRWIEPWSGDGMYWHFVLIGVCALMVALGLLYRWAAALLFVAFSYVFLLEQARYLNHFYLICLVSLIFAVIPAHGAGSLDLRFGLFRGRDCIPTWCLWLIRFQMGVVYFFGGVAKLNSDWLAGEPLRTWLAARSDYPLIGGLLEQEWVVMGMAYGGLFFDLLVVPLLLWPRTRIVAFIGVLFFNFTNGVLFSIGIFPWFAIGMSTVFFSPDWPRRFFVLLRYPGLDRCGPVPRWGVILLAAFVAWQLVLPLRHFAYPGNVSWTEEGHLYAWHMKLRNKSGRILLWVENHDNGERSEVDLNEFMETWQARRMVTKPDMILQFAHFLGAELGRNGLTNISVHADSRVSLNGRRAQSMINPRVDLLEQPDSIWPKDWILPLKEPLPKKSK